MLTRSKGLNVGPAGASAAGHYLGIHAMQHDITHILTDLINGTLLLRQVHFANPTSLSPELALQVDFPRLEIVLEGSVEDRAAPVFAAR
jgi:hypothetical protein